MLRQVIRACVANPMGLPQGPSVWCGAATISRSFRASALYLKPRAAAAVVTPPAAAKAKAKAKAAKAVVAPAKRSKAASAKAATRAKPAPTRQSKTKAADAAAKMVAPVAAAVPATGTSSSGPSGKVPARESLSEFVTRRAAAHQAKEQAKAEKRGGPKGGGPVVPATQRETERSRIVIRHLMQHHFVTEKALRQRELDKAPLRPLTPAEEAHFQSHPMTRMLPTEASRLASSPPTTATNSTNGGGHGIASRVNGVEAVHEPPTPSAAIPTMEANSTDNASAGTQQEEVNQWIQSKLNSAPPSSK